MTSENMEYLENREESDLNLHEEDNEEEFQQPKQKKKNKFKVQNSWLYASDYKSYI